MNRRQQKKFETKGFYKKYHWKVGVFYLKKDDDLTGAIVCKYHTGKKKKLKNVIIIPNLKKEGDGVLSVVGAMVSTVGPILIDIKNDPDYFKKNAKYYKHVKFKSFFDVYDKDCMLDYMDESGWENPVIVLD